MTDVLNSEWLKLRSVRSTTYVLLAIVLCLLVGALVSYLMTADWDTSPPDLQRKFGAADPGVMVVPFAQFCLGVLGALTITSEYGSGMIRTALVSVPQRKAYLLAKTAVVAGASLVVGLTTVLVAYQTGELITGDRPEPISAYSSFTDALPTLLANTASLVLLALLGLGLGFLLRSTAGALVSLCALLFVLPSLTLILPSPWNERVYSVMLPNLAPQLSADYPDAPLSPPAAGLVMLAYLVLALVPGTITLLRRDA
ncbi:ABC transporter permease [Saccharothrix texasensis]|uniref:ABC-2 family transporter n=1 Tax=Saccharothrix texasensis TaxID=103734 RepID=A0A3N1H167_9PSEU|nr:ABC transporter permease [Saccharothrix texasensis]ROP36219.1 ABC-2 family transporter [Saccharothrix texasensis]